MESSTVRFRGGGGILPIMEWMERLRTNGGSFDRLEVPYTKGLGFHELKHRKEKGKLSLRFPFSLSLVLSNRN